MYKSRNCPTPGVSGIATWAAVGGGPVTSSSPPDAALRSRAGSVSRDRIVGVREFLHLGIAGEAELEV